MAITTRSSQIPVPETQTTSSSLVATKAPFARVYRYGDLPEVAIATVVLQGPAATGGRKAKSSSDAESKQLQQQLYAQRVHQFQARQLQDQLFQTLQSQLPVQLPQEQSKGMELDDSASVATSSKDSSSAINTGITRKRPFSKTLEKVPPDVAFKNEMEDEPQLKRHKKNNDSDLGAAQIKQGFLFFGSRPNITPADTLTSKDASSEKTIEKETLAALDKFFKNYKHNLCERFFTLVRNNLFRDQEGRPSLSLETRATGAGILMGRINKFINAIGLNGLVEVKKQQSSYRIFFEYIGNDTNYVSATIHRLEKYEGKNDLEPSEREIIAMNSLLAYLMVLERSIIYLKNYKCYQSPYLFTNDDPLEKFFEVPILDSVLKKLRDRFKSLPKNDYVSAVITLLNSYVSGPELTVTPDNISLMSKIMKLTPPPDFPGAVLMLSRTQTSPVTASQLQPSAAAPAASRHGF